MNVLTGDPVWITGAGSGLGLEFAREFLRRGARVLAVDRDAKALAKLAAEAKVSGLPLGTLAADVGAGKEFTAALEGKVKEHGAPAVFINNAGIARIGGFEKAGLEVFNEVMRVNLSGVVFGTHFALGRMRQRGRGLIINIASTAGLVPSSFMPSYTASKHAVVGFTRSLTLELHAAKSPVRLCLVTPGFIDTPILLQPGAEFPKWFKWTIPKPGPTARKIVAAALSGKDEVTPDFGGRLIQRLYRWAPGLSTRGSNFLLPVSLEP